MLRSLWGFRVFPFSSPRVCLLHSCDGVRGCDISTRTLHSLRKRATLQAMLACFCCYLLLLLHCYCSYPPASRIRVSASRANLVEDRFVRDRRASTARAGQREQGDLRRASLGVLGVIARLIGRFFHREIKCRQDRGECGAGSGGLAGLNEGPSTRVSCVALSRPIHLECPVLHSLATATRVDDFDIAEDSSVGASER
jgi:hypothetical protein